MTYLLDTNVCIQIMNNRKVTAVARLADVPAEEVVVCSVVRAELFFGAERSARPRENHAKHAVFLAPYSSLPFDDRAASEYGRIRVHLAKAGTPIGPNDLLIASIALANDLTLVTHNTSEFGRVPGLRLVDWE